MKIDQDYSLGLTLIAPSTQLHALLYSILSHRKLSSPSPPDQPEIPDIVLKPFTAETIAHLTKLFAGTSPSPILVLCDPDGVQTLKSLLETEVEETTGPDPALISGETRERAAAETSDDTDPRELLSPRELEVLEQLGSGLGNKQIAIALSIAPNTVYTHVRHIQTKLGTLNRTQTALLARNILKETA